MPQFIQNIQIKNFKSAKNVRFEDCKRINLLIGKPNVGKSNLLEALSIFCLPFLKYLKEGFATVCQGGKYLGIVL